MNSQLAEGTSAEFTPLSGASEGQGDEQAKTDSNNTVLDPSHIFHGEEEPTPSSPFPEGEKSEDLEQILSGDAKNLSGEILSGEVELLTGDVELLTGEVQELTGTALELSIARETLNETPITGTLEGKGVTVNVEAPAGTFPDGAKLRILPITVKKELNEIKQQIIDSDESDSIVEDSEIVAFDISFIYTLSDGTEIELQPKNGEGVKVSFNYEENKSLSDAGESEEQEVKVFHIDDKNEEGEKVAQGEEVVKEVKIDEEATTQGEVVVDAESFSVYAVLVTASSYTITYNLNGGYWTENKSTASKTVTYTNGKTSEKRKTPSKAKGTCDGKNCMFIGWYTAATGGTRWTGNPSALTNNTAYAHWLPFEDKTITVGSETIVIMDRNIGATTNDRDNSGSYGYHFQWGNNYGFDHNANDITFPNGETTTSDQVALADWQDYVGNNASTYYSSKWITTNPWNAGGDGSNDWLWGTADDEASMQGPCPGGYHVPTQAEWAKFSDAELDYNYAMNTMNLPFAGRRGCSDFRVSYRGDYGIYWSSTPSNNRSARNMYFSDGIIYWQNGGSRSYGNSVRCFQNFSTPKTLTFNVSENGGTSTAPSSQEYDEGETVTLPACTATKSGYECIGWNTNKDATTPLSTVTLDDDKTVYAIFKKTVTVTFSKGNGVYNITLPASTSCIAWNTATTCSVSPATATCNAGYRSPTWSASTSNLSSSITTTASCTACTAGTYTTAGNTVTSCTDCEVGYYCPAGSAKVACTTLGNKYTHSAAKSTSATACYMDVAAGSYKTSANGNETTGCGAGKYSTSHTSNYGSADNSCTNIEAGCYGSSASSSCPAQCQGRTKYSAAGKSECSTVSAGYYTTGCGSDGNKCTGQSQCTAGTSCSNGVQSSCVASTNTTAGTYSSNAGATSCITASDGNYVATAGASGQTQCTVGNYCKDGKIIACPTGYTSDKGAKAQTECYITVSAGKKKESATASTTINCGAGKYSTEHKSYYNSEDNSCTNIEAGCYGSSASSSCPAQCQGRTKYSAAGKSECSTVSAGYYTTGCGSDGNKCTGQSQCAAGNYCVNGISNSCPSGYDSEAGASACTDVTFPVIEITTQPSTTCSSSKTLSATISDNVGVTSSQYAVVDSATCDSSIASTAIWNSYTTATSLSFDSESDNGKYVCFRASDAAGNTKYLATNQITNIDTAGPGTPSLSLPADNTYTNNNKPTLTWTAGSIAGCSTLANYEIQICSDSSCNTVVKSNTSATNATWTLTTDLSDGTYYWRVREKDSLNRYSTYTSTKSFVVDTTAPTCTISGNPTSWQNTNATLTVNYATEVNTITNAYSWDNSTYSPSKTHEVSANSTYTAYVKDAAGNIGSCEIVVNKIDKSAPTGGSFTIANNATYTTSTAVTLTTTCASDGGAGGVQVAYGNTANPTNWTSCTENISHTLTSGEGTKTVYMRFKDSLGNTTSDITDTIILDTSAPTLSATNAGVWKTSNFTIALNVSDTNGINYSKYSWISAASCLSDGTSFDNSDIITYSTEGESTLYLCARDNAGLTNTWNGTYKLDTVAPSVSFSSENGAVAKSHTVTVTVSDATSKIAGNQSIKYIWQTDPTCSDKAGDYTSAALSPSEAGSTSASTILSTLGLSDGSYYLCILGGTVSDVAGNTNAAKKSEGVFVIDNTDPVITITQANAGTWTKSKTVSASQSEGTLTMSEGTSTVCDETREFTTYQSKTYSSESDNGKYICYRAVDAAGNVTYELSAKVEKIDTTAPVLSSKTTFNNTWYTSDQTSTFTYTDAGAGITEGQNTTSCTISTEGTASTCKVTDTNVCDKLGNCNTSDQTSNAIKLDKTAPVLISQTNFNDTWYNENQTSTFTYGDSVSGISGDSTTSCVISAEGESATCTVISTNICNNAGLCNTTNATSNSIKLDKTNPTCLIQGNPNSPTNQNVNLRVVYLIEANQISDGYSWDDETYSSNQFHEVSANGTYTAYVKDIAGNIGSCSVTMSMIDKTAPEITINNPNTTPAQSKTITASTEAGITFKMAETDDDSDCDVGSSLEFDDYESITYSSESDNGKYVCYKAVDAAGNTTYEISDPISGIDRTGPSLAFSSNVLAGPVKSNTLTAIWGDAVTKKWMYSDSSICSNTESDYNKTYSDSMNQTTETNNGKYICLYAKDSAGNVSTLASAHPINIDITNPTCSISGNPENWTNQSVTLTVTMSDTNVKSDGYSWDGETYSSTQTFTAESNGTYTAHVKDAAGNEGSCSVSVTKIDKTAPVASIESTNTLKVVSQTATLSCTDGVGISKYYRGTENNPEDDDFIALGESTTEFSTTKTVNAAGTYYLLCKDIAGSISNSASKTYHSYEVHNMLNAADKAEGTYNTTNYPQSTTATYIVPAGTTITFANVYTIPTYSVANKYVGYTTSASGTPSDTASVVLNSDSTYYFWFNRDRYSLSLVKTTGIDVIYYKINGSDNYSSTTDSTVVSMKAGSDAYAYAVASNGYTYNTYSLENPKEWDDVEENKTFSPVATINTYTISYVDELNATNTNPTSYNVITSDIELENLEKAGYTFQGWYTTENYTVGTKVEGVAIEQGSTGNKTFYAKWSSPIVYTITYNLNGGSISDSKHTTYTVEDEDYTLLQPTKVGYTFAGWTGSNGEEAELLVVIEQGSTGNKSYTATWTANTNTAYTVKHWKQNLGSDEYTEVVADRENKTGTTADQTAAESKSYYGFTAQAIAQQTIAGNGSTVVNVYYDRNKYKITFVDEDGTTVLKEATEYEYGTLASDIIKPSDPTKTADNTYTYEFAGWDSEVVAVAGNKTYKATYTPSYIDYTVTWKDYNGETLSGATYHYNEDLEVLGDPTRVADNTYTYTFKAWSPELAEKVTADAEYTAEYTATPRGGSSSGGGGGSYKSKDEETHGSAEEEVLTGDVNTVDIEDNQIDSSDDSLNNNQGEDKDGIVGEDLNVDTGVKVEYSEELIDAYTWARDTGITSMPTIERAKVYDGITREQLAKMMVVFASKVLGKKPVINKTAKYWDVSVKRRGQEFYDYIQLAYQYQIMGIDAKGRPIRYFNPSGKVTRAEFATVLSRVLYGSKYNQSGSKYYKKHIQALKKAGILTDTNPKRQELRGWIMLMLYRSLNSIGEK